MCIGRARWLSESACSIAAVCGPTAFAGGSLSERALPIRNPRSEIRTRFIHTVSRRARATIGQRSLAFSFSTTHASLCSATVGQTCRGIP
jgi:hypothetical protein